MEFLLLILRFFKFLYQANRRPPAISVATPAFAASDAGRHRICGGNFRKAQTAFQQLP